MDLDRYEKQRDEGGKAIFDLYRYGLVAVYPFQEEKVSLQKQLSLSGIEVVVEKVDKSYQGLASSFKDIPIVKNQLDKLLKESKNKNFESEMQVKRLGRKAKAVIDREN